MGFPGIKYFVHDGSLFIVPHYIDAGGLADIFARVRAQAVQDMEQARVKHAVYGVKHYDPESGALVEADIYAPAVLLDDAEFHRRTADMYQDHPGCIILAAHNHK